MPELAHAVELSEREISPVAQPPQPLNPRKDVHPGAWLRIRSFLAELAAFPVRIRKTDGKWIVTADLPGVRRDEVRVEVGHMLVVEAEPKLEKGRAFYPTGRRLLRVPNGADIALAKAELKSGVLTVTIPVPYAQRIRHVPVECDENFSQAIRDRDATARSRVC
jgi:HSP20 family molecular chaperone IbpA